MIQMVPVRPSHTSFMFINSVIYCWSKFIQVGVYFVVLVCFCPIFWGLNLRTFHFHGFFMFSFPHIFMSGARH